MLHSKAKHASGWNNSTMKGIQLTQIFNGNFRISPTKQKLIN